MFIVTSKSSATAKPALFQTRSTAFLAAFACSMVFSGLARAGITFDLMHTRPECNYEGHSSTWCEKEDNAAATQRAGMVKRIKSILDDYALSPAQSGAKPKVYVAYLSFSNQEIRKKLCQVGRAGIPLFIVLDNGSIADAADVAECSRDPENPNVSVMPLGGMTSSTWRLHHNKFLIIDPGNGDPWSVNFSSGNLSSFGTGLHLDHWVMMEAEPDSNIVSAHRCVIDGLKAATSLAEKLGMYEDGTVKTKFDQAVAGKYISAREACYKARDVIPMMRAEEALEAEGISASFSPNEGNEVFNVFAKQVKRVIKRANDGKPAYIYIAIQHFLHFPTFNLLNEAAEAGVDVRIVMDDDVVLGSTEVQGAAEFYESNLKGTKLKIRFAETNDEIKQMMHNKLTILDGERTFSGAGHFTTAALQDNWENFYLIENRDLTREYLRYFKEIWDNSLSESAVNGGKDTKPKKLHKKALELLGENDSPEDE